MDDIIAKLKAIRDLKATPEECLTTDDIDRIIDALTERRP